MKSASARRKDVAQGSRGPLWSASIASSSTLARAASEINSAESRQGFTYPPQVAHRAVRMVCHQFEKLSCLMPQSTGLGRFSFYRSRPPEQARFEHLHSGIGKYWATSARNPTLRPVRFLCGSPPFARQHSWASFRWQATRASVHRADAGSRYGGYPSPDPTNRASARQTGPQRRFAKHEQASARHAVAGEMRSNAARTTWWVIRKAAACGRASKKGNDVHVH
jgi:hypothetical protein